MLYNVSFIVAPDDAGKRLDKLAATAFKSVSRKSISRAFDSGKVLLPDGSHAVKGAAAVLGALIRITELQEIKDECAAASEGFLDVVYEDSRIIAFNKPAGQNCHPVTPEETDTLVNAMLFRYPETRDAGGDAMMPALIHRIDSGTSGLVLAARTRTAFEFVRAQFTKHSVKKIYIAEVEGHVTAPGGVSGYLAHTAKGEGVMREVGAGGAGGKLKPMKAETFYRPIRNIGCNTLLEVTIYTGVTHQIRCQLAGIGHPVAGDVLYGAKVIHGEIGHRLHSFSATFIHPEIGEIVVRAPKIAFI